MAHSGKVKPNTAEESASTSTVVVAANGDEDGAAVADSEAPQFRGLSRKESMKDATNKAVEHYKEHKWKYIACKVVVGLAIGLGVGLGIAVAVLKRQGVSLLSLSAKKAASTGTSLPVVSPFPSKGDKSRRRMLVVEQQQQQLRRLDTAVGVASLPAACDYNVHTPEYVVNDKSTDSVKFINMVSCLTDQLRISDVAINTTMNPSRLPYIAMVDGTKCGMDARSMLWTVETSAPSEYGADGDYASDLSFNIVTGGQGSSPTTMHARLKNTIKGGALTSSKLNFDGGFVSLEFSDAATEVKSLNDGGYSYIHASFDPKTSSGKAVSSSVDFSTGAVSTYKLAFNSGAILKEASVTYASSYPSAPPPPPPPPPVTTCVDFSIGARKLFGDRYSLFSATDGSRAAALQGFPITAEFPADFTEPVDAYASYWGLWANYGHKSDGSFADAQSKFVDGIKVTKQNYDAAGSSSQYTLKLANAKLRKTTSHSISLGDLKGFPLRVWNWRSSAPPFMITWDGSKLVRVSQSVNGCFGNLGNNQYGFAELADGVSISSYSDCSCLSSSAPYTVKSSGPQSFSSFWMNEIGQTTYDTPIEFIPTADDYGQGIDVASEDQTLNGMIKLKYQTVQSLYGVKDGYYVKGKTVTQTSTGATGTVAETTKMRIFGLDTSTASFTGTWSSYSSTCGSPITSSVQYLQTGTVVTQKQYTKAAAGTISTSTIDVTVAPTELKVGMMVSCNSAVTATITAATPGSNIVTVNSATGILVGMSISGDVLSKGSKVVSISSTQLTLNFPAVDAASSGTLTFGCPVQPYTYITAISSTAITLSKKLVSTFTSLNLDFAVAGTTTEGWGGWGGLPVQLVDNSAGFFDSVNDLKLVNPEGSSSTVSGSISYATGTGISSEWDSFVIVTAGSGCPSGSYNPTLSWTGIKSAAGNVIKNDVLATWDSSISPNTITVNDATGINGGDSVTGQGIPDGITVQLISSNVITLSATLVPYGGTSKSKTAVTIDGKSYYCSFTSSSTTIDCGYIAVSFETGKSVSGTGIVTGTTVLSSNSGSITLSTAPAAASNGKVTFGAPFPVSAYVFSGEDKVQYFYGNLGSWNTGDKSLGSDCTDATVTVSDCTTPPVLKVRCQRQVKATSTTLKVQRSSSSTAFAKCNSWNGESCEVTVDGASAGSPYWSWNEQGDLVPITKDTELVYRTDSFVNADETVPTLICSSTSGQCPKGTDIATLSGSSSYSAGTYSRPSMLSTTVSKDSSGVCYTPAKTGEFTKTFSNVGGSPAISIEWDDAAEKDKYGTTDLWGVKFLKLTDRGKNCASSSPNVTFSAPKIKATFSSGATSITITEFTSGKLSAGMAISGTGIATGTIITSCTSFTSAGATCVVSIATTSAQTAVVVTGDMCSSYPTATLSCEEGNDLVSIPQAYSYTFNSASGILTDTTPTTGAAVANTDADYLSFGPFFEKTDANLAKLACDYDSSITCSWKATSELSVYYTYTTGKNEKRVNLIDAANKVIKFDAPQTLLYKHKGTESNSGVSYDGAVMLLRYDGPGQLYGFPMICFNDDMEKIPCVKCPYGPGRCSDSTQSYADIVVSDDVVLTAVGDGSTYYTKPEVMVERYPKAASQTTCAGLALTDLPSVPTAADAVADPPLKTGSFPADSVTAKYLNGGNPVVVSGQTLYELAAASA